MSKIRRVQNALFQFFCYSASILGLLVLAFLLGQVLRDGLPWLDWQFLSSSPSRFPEKAGVFPQLLGSFYLVLLLIPIAIPFGITAALYLEEYAKRSWHTQLIEMNIANLAAVPSIIFGLLGLGVFVRWLGMGPGVLLLASLTLSLRVLPLIIISCREAIRAVPYSHREAAYALGASKWECVRSVVLPQALPGIMTGVILAVSNAIGESAPLIMIGVASSIFRAPRGLLSPIGALPLQIFKWSDYPKAEFQHGVTPAPHSTLKCNSECL